MTTQRLCCAMPDGTVRILSPAPEMFNPQSRTRALLAERGKLPIEATEQEVWAFIRAKDAPKEAVSVRAHDVSELPPHREFRNAWTHDGVTLSVDMPKARVIHMDRIRRARKPELERLDVEWMRAMGKKDQAAADTFEAQREALRQIPQVFDLNMATTPEELRSMWPASLPR